MDFISIALAAENAAEAVASESPISVLGLNLKLFIAQIVNFAIVLFILWKWAYKPLVRKLNERASKIEKGLKDAQEAEQKRSEAEKLFAQKIEEAKKEAYEIIESAKGEAEKQKQIILQAAKAETDKFVEDAKKKIEDDKNRAITEAKKEISDMVFVVVEKVLKEMMTEKMDKKSIQEFIAKKITSKN